MAVVEWIAEDLTDALSGPRRSVLPKAPFAMEHQGGFEERQAAPRQLAKSVASPPLVPERQPGPANAASWLRPSSTNTMKIVRCIDSSLSSVALVFAAVESMDDEGRDSFQISHTNDQINYLRWKVFNGRLRK